MLLANLREKCKICNRMKNKFCDEKGQEYNLKEHLVLIRSNKDDFMCPDCYKNITTCLYCKNIVLNIYTNGTKIEEDGSYAVCDKCYERLNCWKCDNCQDCFQDYEKKVFLGAEILCSECALNPSTRLNIQRAYKKKAREELIEHIINLISYKPKPNKIHRRKSVVEFTFKIDQYDNLVGSAINKYLVSNNVNHNCWWYYV